MDVSVALPTYNGANYLPEQLDSILSQSHPPFEIIISDDGSTDQTQAIAQEYVQKYPSIVEFVENRDGSGVASNFENAISHCSGDVISLSDQDDIWKENKLEIGVRKLQTSSAGLVFHDATIVTENLEPIGSLWKSAGYAPDPDPQFIVTLDELLHRNMVQGAATMFRSELVDHIVPIPNVRHYDHYIAIISHVIMGIQPIPQQLSKYRQHDAQDLGAPPGQYSFYKLLKIGLQKEPTMSIENARHWKNIETSIRSLPKQEFQAPAEEILNRVSRRKSFSEKREVVHTESRKDGIVAIAQNIASGGYAQFGYGPRGSLNLGRDLLGILGV